MFLTTVLSLWPRKTDFPPIPQPPVLGSEAGTYKIAFIIFTVLGTELTVSYTLRKSLTHPASLLHTQQDSYTLSKLLTHSESLLHTQRTSYTLSKHSAFDPYGGSSQAFFCLGNLSMVLEFRASRTGVDPLVPSQQLRQVPRKSASLQG